MTILDPRSIQSIQDTQNIQDTHGAQDAPIIQDTQDTQETQLAQSPADQPEAAPMATSINPDTIKNGCANITTLLRLAGKSDLLKISDLQAALMSEIELVRQAINLLTCTTDQPVRYNFGQLIPDVAIDAYRDDEGCPLPGANPRFFGFQPHMVEIPYDDPSCDADARRIFV